jgi:hypothetical protein
MPWSTAHPFPYHESQPIGGPGASTDADAAPAPHTQTSATATAAVATNRETVPMAPGTGTFRSIDGRARGLEPRVTNGVFGRRA